MSVLILHLEESSENMMRNENFEKLVVISEELLDTLKYLCNDEKSLVEQYFSDNDWAIDYITNSTSVHKFWNSNLLVDTAFYLRSLELKFGNTEKFWEQYEKRGDN